MSKNNYINLGLGVVYNGDCLDIMKDMPDNSVDMILTSPPYDNLRDYNKYNFDFDSIAKQLYRITTVGGTVVWNVGDSTIKGSESLTAFKQAIFFKDEVGFNIHDTMIWQKPAFGYPSKKRYHQIFEYVFILTKGDIKTFNPIIDRKNIYGGLNRKQGFSRNKEGLRKNLESRVTINEYGMRHNIWYSKTSGNDGTSKKYKHPAMFSEDFARDHIISWSNEGDTIFDPFIGSGTTGIVANSLKRKWIGCEISEDYCKIIRERYDISLMV